MAARCGNRARHRFAGADKKSKMRFIHRLFKTSVCLLMITGILASFAAGANAQTVKAPRPEKPKMEKVILDTDIGDDIDDAYALALLMAMPNARVLGVTTAWGQTQERAELTTKLLRVMGHANIPVVAGRRGDAQIRGQYAWAQHKTEDGISHDAANHNATNHDATMETQKEDAVEFMRRQFDHAPGEITLIAIGPLVNVGDLLTRYPDTKNKIKRIVIMGGAVHRGYNGQAAPTPEWNIKCDPKAARIVYTSGVPLTMAGLEATAMLQFDVARQKRLFALGTPTTDALAALTILWGNNVPTLYDPMAVAWAMGGAFCETEQRHVVVDDDGMTRITDGPPNVTVLVNPQKYAFLDWYITQIATHSSRAIK